MMVTLCRLTSVISANVVVLHIGCQLSRRVKLHLVQSLLARASECTRLGELFNVLICRPIFVVSCSMVYVSRQRDSCVDASEAVLSAMRLVVASCRHIMKWSARRGMAIARSTA